MSDTKFKVEIVNGNYVSGVACYDADFREFISSFGAVCEFRKYDWHISGTVNVTIAEAIEISRRGEVRLVFASGEPSFIDFEV